MAVRRPGASVEHLAGITECPTIQPVGGGGDALDAVDQVEDVSLDAGARDELGKVANAFGVL